MNRSQRDHKEQIDILSRKTQNCNKEDQILEENDENCNQLDNSFDKTKVDLNESTIKNKTQYTKINPNASNELVMAKDSSQIQDIQDFRSNQKEPILLSQQSSLEIQDKLANSQQEKLPNDASQNIMDQSRNQSVKSNEISENSSQNSKNANQGLGAPNLDNESKKSI